MKRLLSITRLALLAAPLASMGAPAPEGNREEPTAFAARHAGVDGELSLAEARAGIADLEPMLIARRDYEGAFSRLEGLQALLLDAPGADANSRQPETPDELESVRLILLAKVEVRLAEGKLKQAELVLDDSAFGGPGHKQLRESVFQDSRIAEAKAYLEAKRTGRTAAAPKQYMLLPYDSDDDAIDKIVAETLTETDPTVVNKVMGALGVRAVPALVKAIAANLDVAPSLRPDPLTLLVGIEPLTAAVVMRENMEAGGYLWKRRMAANLYTGMGHWFDYSSKPAVCLSPDGLALVEFLIADEEVGAEAMTGLPKLKSAYGTPGIFQGMQRALASENSERREAAIRLLTSSGPITALVPYQEAALDSPFLDVRVAASRQLAELSWNEALVAHRDDPSPLVRQNLNRVLQVRNSKQPIGNWDLEGGSRVQYLDERSRELLLFLLQDSALEIRREAVESLAFWPKEYISVEYFDTARLGAKRFAQQWRLLSPPSLDVLMQLAQEPDMKVRESLVKFMDMLKPTMGIPVLRTLAGGTEFEVARRSLQSIPKDWFLSDAVGCLSIYEAYFASNPDQDQVLFQQLASDRNRFLASGPGAEALVSWLIPFGLNVVTQVIGQENGTHPFLKDHLTSETYRNYVKLHDGRHDQVLYSMGNEPDASLKLQILALMAVAKNENDLYWQGPLQALLQRPIWRDEEFLRLGYAGTISHQIAWVKDEEAIPFGLSIIQDRSIPDSVVDQIVGSIGFRGEGGLELAERIKQRFFDPNDTEVYSSSLNSLVDSMPYDPGLRDDGLLAALITSRLYENDVVQTIRALKDPALLYLLADVVRTRHGEQVWTTTVNYVLPGFLTDESAALLLEAASLAQNAEVREKCMQSLESMRTYFLARDYWTQRKLDGGNNKTAIAELLVLLDDPDATTRVHAIRGLATFDAIGSIPKLIGLLKDPSPEVAQAAKLALDRLNRPQDDEDK